MTIISRKVLAQCKSTQEHHNALYLYRREDHAHLRYRTTLLKHDGRPRSCGG